MDAESAAIRIAAMLREEERRRMKEAGGYEERCLELCPSFQTQYLRQAGDDGLRIQWRAIHAGFVYKGHVDVLPRELVGNLGDVVAYAVERLHHDAWEVLAVAAGAMPPRGAPGTAT